METPLRGRSGGHTGAAPTISHVAPCPKVAGEVLADGQTQEMIAGEVLADGLIREKVAGEVLADDYPCGLSQERGSSDEMTARYGGRQAFAGEMMVLQNDVRLPVSRPLRKK